MAEPSNNASHGRSASVLRFRPRTSAQALHRDTAAPSVTTDAAEHAPDDFRHRMLVNAAGFACAVTLTAAGIWLASSISDLRLKQDCVLTGRRDCAPIAAVDKPTLPARQH